MATNGHPLDALGDRTRRQIFELLRSGPRSVGDLAAGLPVSRPAVSQHLRVLEDVGLVTHHRSGTRNLYEPDSAGVATLRDWVDGFWSEALARFKSVAEEASRTGFLAADGQTRVELEHRGWENVELDAPAKRGDYDAGWGVVLGRYVDRAG